MAYATAADMIARYDSRTLGDVCADNGQRVAEADLTTNTKMLAALSSASGEVNARALQGERYTAADLSALTGDGLAFLKTIVCEVAFSILWRRKPYTEDNLARKDALERADQILNDLRTGVLVFDVTANKEAGRPKIDTVTRVAIQQQNLIVDQSRGRFFPARRTYGD